jgi:leucyl aminopeptidase
MTSSAYKLISEDFDAIASQSIEHSGDVLVVETFSSDIEAIGFAVETDGVPADLGVNRDALAAAGFEGKIGQSLLLVQPAGPAYIAVGAGAAGTLTPALLRDLAAAFARAAHRYERVGLDIVGLDVDAIDGVSAESLGQVLTEGILLARYRYTVLKPTSKHVPLMRAELRADATESIDVVRGVHIGKVRARAVNLTRDLANTPPSHLTATDLGAVAIKIGPDSGLVVDVFDKEQLIELGCGGLLGVNAGSVEEPRMIQLRYTPTGVDGTPAEPRGHVSFVGKGITYDSGGISLKPSNPMHVLMKMDMAGAGAVLAAMTTLKELGCQSAVSAFLMCTDNLPSGSALKLGDVLTIHGGKTVEVKNTDAEGRLVMSDALSLAAEEKPDAIVDIATLTGAALMALGPSTAAVLGNNQPLIDQLTHASAETDEQLWQLPLEKKYRKMLDSDVADISNVGGASAGATTAALFLSEFVDDIPWAHLDIAGPMAAEADELWRSQGATGFGTRLLIDFALNFAAPSAATPSSATGE